MKNTTDFLDNFYIFHKSDSRNFLKWSINKCSKEKTPVNWSHFLIMVQEKLQ